MDSLSDTTIKHWSGKKVNSDVCFGTGHASKPYSVIGGQGRNGGIHCNEGCVAERRRRRSVFSSSNFSVGVCLNTKENETGSCLSFLFDLQILRFCFGINRDLLHLGFDFLNVILGLV